MLKLEHNGLTVALIGPRSPNGFHCVCHRSQNGLCGFVWTLISMVQKTTSLKVNPVRLITRPVVVESTFAQCADSQSVLKSPSVLLHYEMACALGFFSAALSKVSLFSQGQRSRREDNIDIHAARSYGVTSVCPVPHMSVSTVSLVAGEM